MIIRISSSPQPYDWGSTTAIPNLLGVEPNGQPQAELWFGAHDRSETHFVDPPLGVPSTLNEWVKRRGNSAAPARLPFLMKVLAADRPLSLQAHPTLEQARKGFDDEEQRQIHIDAPTRNYRDRWHKPELIVALEDGFQALCGFREPEATSRFLRAMSAQASPEQAEVLEKIAVRLARVGLEPVVGALLRDSDVGVVDALVSASRSPVSGWEAESELICRLSDVYPSDMGIAVAALMNFVTLAKNEALFLPAGNIHAYVRGIGVEIMASSDNVLRGGLTSKNIDVDELLSVLEFSSSGVPRVAPVQRSDGAIEYPVPVVDFQLFAVDAGKSAELELRRPSIVLSAEGRSWVRSATQHVHLAQGEVAFVEGLEHPISIGTSGRAYIGTGAGG